MVGLAITFGPVVVFKAVAGVHVYAVAPIAIKLIELPMQITAGLGILVTVGLEITVAMPVCV
jgi:hypothetical protein